MAFDTVVRGGLVVRPEGVKRLDIGIIDGAVAELAPELPLGSRKPGSSASPAGAPREIDATGVYVYPGVIDAHVHFNDPGRAHWEGAATGSTALAAGGGTCFVDMPLNSSPPTLDGASFDAKRAALEAVSRTDFALYGGLTPENLETMEELAERGVVGFKAFMCPSGIDDFQWADDLTLLRGMEIAAGLDLPVLLHAESAAITGALTEAAVTEGRTDAEAFLESRPVIAELEAIERALLYAEETGARVHIVHVSNLRGVELIRRAVTAGRVDATCETCPHYLLFAAKAMIRLGARAKCAPPLRDEPTRKALIEAVEAGRVDTVGSDHSPAPAEMKDTETFSETWGGIPGVQTTLRALLTVGLSPERIARLTAAIPARRFRLPRKGALEIGGDADFVLVEDSGPAPLRREELRDRHRLSPYVGVPLRGKIRGTYLRGMEITEKTRGRLLTAEPDSPR